MKRKAIKKEFRVELLRSLPRFLSILFIVALGVAFFAGIRATKPDMEISADYLYDSRDFMDLQIISTLGLVLDDMDALKEQERVEEAEGAYSRDVLLRTGERQFVIKMISIPEKLNRITLKEGRMPQEPYECLVDTSFFDQTHYKIGDKIKMVSGDEDALGDTLKWNRYTIVGSCSSPYYLSRSRGSSTIGNGKIDNFIMIPKDSFSLSAFTEIYITLKDVKELPCYSDAYRNEIEEFKEQLELSVQPVREKARYDAIIKEANETLDDAKIELEDGEAEASEKLADARNTLDDAKKKIEEGEAKVKENETKIADGKKEIAEGKEKLEDGKREIEDSEAKLAKAEQDLAKGERELEAGKQNYKEKKAELFKGREELEKARGQLDATEMTLSAAKEELNKGKEGIDAQEESGLITAEEAALMREGLSEKETELAAGWEQLKTGKAEFAKQEKLLLEGEEQLKAGKQELDASGKKIKKAREELDSGIRKLADGKKEIKDNEISLEKAQKELEDGEKELLEGKEELLDAREELSDGERDYAEAKVKAEEEIEGGKEKIKEAEEEISKIKPAEWYLLTREQIQTYVEFGQDAERIGAVGEIFPIIFFLVAALVSLTTMTRMVEEQRTQIGTLKALGYSKLMIAMKYIKYAFLATLGGSILGGISGCIILPQIIITAYRIMYQNLEVIKAPFNKEYVLMASGIAILCVLLATAASCYKELLATPAKLMRPVAPKQGKRVLLERIPFIWKHLNFTKKATVRNLFRYKKRFFMTIVGIGGCMALLLVGFGVRDSIFSIATLQYEEVQVYDALLGLDDSLSAKDRVDLEEMLEQEEEITAHKYQKKSSVTAGFGKEEMEVFLTVFDSKEETEQYIRFRNRTNQKVKYQLSDNGVIITEKMARNLGVKAGDDIYIREEDSNHRMNMKVEAVAENYVNHYIYMTADFYKKLYGEAVQYNEIMVMETAETKEEEEALAERILSLPAVTSISLSDSMSDWFKDMLSSMDIVIVVLIVSAGGLAFVVLYNLNNISINERKRELATIKVLGFYDLEVSEYIYRENVVLTVLGMMLGALMGIILHRFVIITCEINLVMFGRTIFPMSYLYSVLLTCLFSLLINFTMHFKLKKVDMAASLKSVE